MCELCVYLRHLKKGTMKKAENPVRFSWQKRSESQYVSCVFGLALSGFSPADGLRIRTKYLKLCRYYYMHNMTVTDSDRISFPSVRTHSPERKTERNRDFSGQHADILLQNWRRFLPVSESFSDTTERKTDMIKKDSATFCPSLFDRIRSETERKQERNGHNKKDGDFFSVSI